jgi:hypothetical protein
MAFWDKEESIIIVDKNKVEKVEFKYCELKNKQYIALTYLKKTNEEYKPIGGTSIPIESFRNAADAVDLFLKTHDIKESAQC